MKEVYFTPENINEKSQQILFDVEKVVKIKELDFDIKKSALLVLDMQEFFLNENSHAFIPSANAIIPNIQKLVGKFEQAQRPVVFTKHINTDENAGMMGNWWKDVLREENKLSQLDSRVNLLAHQNKVLEKTQYDAFYNTELESILKENNVEQVVITGVMTHLCCETTARSTFVRGYKPFFVVDATATYNEDFHRASILNLAHGFAIPCLAEDL